MSEQQGAGYPPSGDYLLVPPGDLAALHARVAELEAALKTLADPYHKWDGKDCNVVHAIASKALALGKSEATT